MKTLFVRALVLSIVTIGFASTTKTAKATVSGFEDSPSIMGPNCAWNDPKFCGMD